MFETSLNGARSFYGLAPNRKFAARKLSSGHAITLVVGGLLIALVHALSAHDYNLALESYRARSLEKAEKVDTAIEAAFNQIYQNIRTISMLPSVRGLDRHGTNLGSDARTSIHQIYNNLASNVAISELYIVPGDFDPDRIDPATGEGEAPILMFDELITAFPRDYAQHSESQAHIHTDGPKPEEEVEIFEYRQFRETMAWLRQRYPNAGKVRGMDVPFISGREVITCDNTEYNKTKNDADRKGLLFSVPFFDVYGNFKGTVSAIVRTNAIRRLLTSADYAIVNTADDYVAGASQGGQQGLSIDWVRQGKPDPQLLFSRVLPIAVNQGSGQWQLWVGHSNGEFLESSELAAIRNFRYVGYCASGLGMILGIGFWNWTVTRERRQAEIAQWRDLSNAAVEGLVVCRGDSLVASSRSFNETMGLGERGVDGMTISDLVHDDDVVDHLRSHNGKGLETDLFRIEGNKIPVEIISRAISYEGRPHRVLAIRDLRERKKAEERIAQQISELRDLLAQNEDLRERLQRSNESAASVNERIFRRIGSDLHDGPLQLLTFVLMRLHKFAPLVEAGGQRSIDELERMRESINDTLRELRSISSGLALPELDASTLENSIRLAVVAHEQRTNTTVNADVAPLPAEVPHALKICAYRFVQEALNNSYRHGDAKDQRVCARVANGIEIAVSDAGPGFSIKDVKGDRLGLSGLRARIEALGGTFEITSSPFEQTLLKAHFNLAKLHPHDVT
jgi:PAS domain S-box-containing protein